MNITDRYLNIICDYKDKELTDQLITFFDKNECIEIRILAGAEAFLKILQHSDWSNNKEISNLKTKLYKKIDRKSTRLNSSH